MMNLMPKKTLDGILGSFRKTQAELQKFVEVGEKEREDNNNKINTMRERNLDIVSDNQRATKVINKLSEFLGEKDETVDA